MRFIVERFFIYAKKLLSKREESLEGIVKIDWNLKSKHKDFQDLD